MSTIYLPGAWTYEQFLQLESTAWACTMNTYNMYPNNQFNPNVYQFGMPNREEVARPILRPQRIRTQNSMHNVPPSAPYSAPNVYGPSAPPQSLYIGQPMYTRSGPWSNLGPQAGPVCSCGCLYTSANVSQQPSMFQQPSMNQQMPVMHRQIPIHQQVPINQQFPTTQQVPMNHQVPVNQQPMQEPCHSCYFPCGALTPWTTVPCQGPIVPMQPQTPDRPRNHSPRTRSGSTANRELNRETRVTDMAIMMSVIQRFVEIERRRYSASLTSESSGYASNSPDNGNDPSEEDDEEVIEEEEEEFVDEQLPNQYQNMYPNLNQYGGIPDATYHDARDLAQEAMEDLICELRNAIDNEFENNDSFPESNYL